MYFIRFYICREIISNTQWNHLDRTLQFESDSLEYDFRLRLELCDVLKVKRPLLCTAFLRSAAWYSEYASQDQR